MKCLVEIIAFAFYLKRFVVAGFSMILIVTKELEYLFLCRNLGKNKKKKSWILCFVNGKVLRQFVRRKSGQTQNLFDAQSKTKNK